MYYLIDYHTHSTHSTDGHNSILEMCQSAVDKGISEIAITDHYEPTEGDEGCRDYKPNAYWVDILKAREVFKGRLRIKMGVELGQPHRFRKTSGRLLDSFPYDYVIGSAHKLLQGMDVSELDFSRMTIDELSRIYLKELKELAEWGRFDCIGHIDLIKRYGTSHYGKRVTLLIEKDLLEEVLKIIISKGRGIEINTSGLRQAPQEAMPGIDVLRLYRELGGEVLTIGSDSHHAMDVGKGVINAMELAMEAGFEYITAFTDRKPKWNRIAHKKRAYSFSRQLNIS